MPNRTPPPATITMVKSSSPRPSLFRMEKWTTISWHYLSLWHHPLALVWCHSLLWVPLLRVPRVGLPAPELAQAPTSPAALRPPSGCLGVGTLTPAPLWTQGPAQAISTLFLHLSDAAALAVTKAWMARRPYICFCRSGLGIFTQHPKCSSGSQSLLSRDQLGGGSMGRGKASEGHSPLDHSDAPTTPLSLLPQPTPGHHGLGTYGR